MTKVLESTTSKELMQDIDLIPSDRFSALAKAIHECPETARELELKIEQAEKDRNHPTSENLHPR